MEEACKNGDLERVKYLFEKGTPIGRWAIIRASCEGHFGVVKYLLEKGAPIDTEAICRAVWLGNIKAVKYLFEKGAPVSGDALYFALEKGNPEVVKYLISINAPRYIATLGKIEEIINNTRKYRQELLQILEYTLGHHSYIILDYLEYAL